MKAYFVTEAQMWDIFQEMHYAKEYYSSWSDDASVDEINQLCNKLEQQCIATEHEWIDDKMVNSLALELFKIGKYMDCLESTLSQYSEKDAQEMLYNIKCCRTRMENILGKKVR